MTERAFETEELGLGEAEKAAAIHAIRTAGQPSVDELLRSIERNGQDQSILESALGLSLEDYRVVEEAWNKAPAPVKKWRKS